MRYVRLKKRAAFGEVFKNGYTVGDRYMVLFVLRNRDTGLTRVGFTTQKAIGSAAKRNRERRRLRALYQLYSDKVSSDYDLIFLGKKRMMDAPWDELKRSMQGLLRRAGLF